MPRLVAESPEFAGTVYDLYGEAMSLGRSPDNTIQLEHPSVSSNHAELIYEDGDYKLVDQNSTNGTRVNDERISEVVLRNYDVVMVGHMILRYESENVLAAPPLPDAGQLFDFGVRAAGRPASYVNLAPFPKPSTKGGGMSPLVMLAGLLAFASLGFLVCKVAGVV